MIRNRVEVHDPFDPILQGAESGNWFNANFGLALNQVDRYYIGIAAYNLLPSQTDWMVSSFENKTDITYAMNGMYRFTLVEKVLFLEGNAYVITQDFKKIQYGGNGKFIINKDVLFSVGYDASANTMKGGFGINVQNLSFGYCGSYSFGDVYGYSFTKHEIVLMLNILYSGKSKE